MIRELFDFGYSLSPEDRWMRFALRLSFVGFVIALEGVIVAAVIKLALLR